MKIWAANYDAGSARCRCGDGGPVTVAVTVLDHGPLTCTSSRRMTTCKGTVGDDPTTRITSA